MQNNSEILHDFYEISRIPRCTFKTKAMREFLLNFAYEHGFSAVCDEAGNIYAHRGTPKICLQAHYDMVCVGDAPNIKIVQKDGFLSAKNSSLGADDGIGVAICMMMMREFSDLEVLFTNDEESGLMGASSCEFEIKSKKLLNLDSENENEICIGSAGGVDVKFSRKISFSPKIGQFFELSTRDFIGGHSGIEIAKNIPSAIKVLANFIRENGGKIAKISGGERHNSIPVNARAIAIFSDENSAKFFDSKAFKFTNKQINITPLNENQMNVINESDEILDFLCAFHQGVYAYDENTMCAQSSANLSILSMKNDEICAEVFARFMKKESANELKSHFKALGNLARFDVKFENESAPWTPVETKFAKEILNIIKRFNENVKMHAIHAGLECGVLCEKDAKMEAVSIGPNIFSPHTTHERVEIASVKRCENIVREIVKLSQI